MRIPPRRLGAVETRLTIVVISTSLLYCAQSAHLTTVLASTIYARLALILATVRAVCVRHAGFRQPSLQVPGLGERGSEESSHFGCGFFGPITEHTRRGYCQKGNNERARHTMICTVKASRELYRGRGRRIGSYVPCSQLRSFVRFRSQRCEYEHRNQQVRPSIYGAHLFGPSLSCDALVFEMIF